MNRYNFVLIFPDQWRGDCLSIAGHPHVQTTYIDDIASNGVWFDHAYSACPTCIPSRACLAMGLNSDHTGRLGYADKVEWDYKHTLMQQLRDGGYQTMQAGKTHFFPQRAMLGFEESRLYEVPKFHQGFESDYHKWLYEATGGKIEDTARTLNPNTFAAIPWQEDAYYHPTNWTTRQAIDLLERHDPTRPFFLQVGYHRPHSPYDPPLYYYDRLRDEKITPPPYGDWTLKPEAKTYGISDWSGKIDDKLLADMRRAYYASVNHLDSEIGKLFHYLNKNGYLYNTFVIFMSDHGDMLGDHYLHRKAVPFEGAVKIPFVVYPPKSFSCQRGQINHTPVSHIDILPTLLELAGIAPAGRPDGISLVPAIRDGKQKQRYIHGEHTNPHLKTGWQYLVNGKEKYIFETLSGQEYYFDLTQDPTELHNAIHDNNKQGRIEELRKQLIQILGKRPRDGIVQNGHLTKGNILPCVRKERDE